MIIWIWTFNREILYNIKLTKYITNTSKITRFLASDGTIFSSLYKTSQFLGNFHVYARFLGLGVLINLDSLSNHNRGFN